MLATTLLVPVLLFAFGILANDMPLVSVSGSIFTILTAFLISLTTTRTRPYFVRKLAVSAILAAAYYFAIFVVFWTWAEEDRFLQSEEWSPIGIEVVTGPIRGAAGLFCTVLIYGLLRLVSVIEVPEPS